MDSLASSLARSIFFISSSSSSSFSLSVFLSLSLLTSISPCLPLFLFCQPQNGKTVLRLEFGAGLFSPPRADEVRVTAKTLVLLQLVLLLLLLLRRRHFVLQEFRQAGPLAKQSAIPGGSTWSLPSSATRKCERLQENSPSPATKPKKENTEGN